MTVEQIAALPVDDLAESSANLFCWTTQKFLPDCLAVVAAWGFRYRQTLVWRKSSCSPLGGSVSPNNVEFLLVARRGQWKLSGRLTSCVIDAPQQKKHSRKPDKFFDLIEAVSPGPYLELFARRQRLGWDTWGNEALEHVEIPA
jgi:N6-adenosine-specific RNA methylase IME4